MIIRLSIFTLCFTCGALAQAAVQPYDVDCTLEVEGASSTLTQSFVLDEITVDQEPLFSKESLDSGAFSYRFDAFPIRAGEQVGIQILLYENNFFQDEIGDLFCETTHEPAEDFCELRFSYPYVKVPEARVACQVSPITE